MIFPRCPFTVLRLVVGLAMVVSGARLGRGADVPPAGVDPGNVAAGHSWHGEAFNEGPRQQAYLMSGMPPVTFPITTTNELARQFFNQGVGQLHGFWYLEAERSFRRVQSLDPNCAMAFWGLTMANVHSEGRARGFITNATARLVGTSPREQLYIQALADYYTSPSRTNEPPKTSTTRRRDLVRAYEEIVRRFPEDLEAKAFLLCQVWDNSGADDSLRLSSHQPLDELARQILAREPRHPVHHYRIHLWDQEQPLQALDSAARCGQGSPGIAHLWHMPGHTYAHLARHDDAAWQQEASARVDHAHQIRDRVLPDQIHNYAHNNDWLAESWSFVGRVREAIDLAKNMVELPRLARTNAALASNPLAYRYDFGSSSWSRGRGRLLQLLTRFELWDELAALADTPYLEPTDVPDEQAALARALVLADLARGDKSRATQQLAQIEASLKAVRDERQGAVDFAEVEARRDRKSPEDRKKAMSTALASFEGRLDRLEGYAAEVRARIALANGDTNALRAELEIAKGVPREALALLRWDAGDSAQALEIAAEVAAKATNQFHPAALHADLLWRVGKTNEAQAAFRHLRELRIWPDPELPVFRRLGAVAQSLGLPLDWRVPPPERTDVGVRPPLDSLGPRHWHPSPAPGWSLADVDGRKSSLSDFRGRPVVVVFYLGRGCPHCLEQLNAFAPAAERFTAAGIALVAVSTDSADGLRRTVQKDGARPFPFPLLADPGLGAFKAWRAFDDFEEIPLHGTFLVDAAGWVRWQDIGHEPFLDTGFLLAEARRLLRFAVGPLVAGVTP